MPNHRKMYLNQGSMISNNLLKQIHMHPHIPLTRKSTSVSSVQNLKVPPALRRKDLKSLAYLNDTINNSKPPIKLKSCLSTQKQGDKLKMKVKFYIKKNNNKLHHMTHTKSAHCLNKIKTIANHPLDGKVCTAQQGYPNRSKSKSKFSQRYMAGDHNFSQTNIKIKHNRNSYLTKKIKNMIAERNKRLSDTSLTLYHKSLKSKKSTSCSSITKYEIFKSKLNKKDIRNYYLKHTLSHSTMKKPKVMIDKKHSQHRICPNVPVKKYTSSKYKSHFKKKLTNSLTRTNTTDTICDKCRNKPQRNLSACFYRDICVTGKKLTLWAKQKKSNNENTNNFQKNCISCPEISHNGLKSRIEQLNDSRIHQQTRKHRLNKLKLWGDLTIHKSKTIIPKSTNVRANLYVFPDISSEPLRNNSYISSKTEISQTRRQNLLNGTLHLNKKCRNVTGLKNNGIKENKLQSNIFQHNRNTFLPSDKALVNSLKQLCFNRDDQNDQRNLQNFVREQRPSFVIKQQPKYSRMHRNTSYNNCDKKPMSMITEKLSHIFSRNRFNKRQQKYDSHSKDMRCNQVRRSEVLLRDIACDCSQNENCSCLSVSLLDTRETLQTRCSGYENEICHNKRHVCKKFADCFNKLKNKTRFNSMKEDICNKCKREKSDCECRKVQLKNKNKQKSKGAELKQTTKQCKATKLSSKSAKYNINNSDCGLMAEDSNPTIDKSSISLISDSRISPRISAENKMYVKSISDDQFRDNNCKPNILKKHNKSHMVRDKPSNDFNNDGNKLGPRLFRYFHKKNKMNKNLKDSESRWEPDSITLTKQTDEDYTGNENQNIRYDPNINKHRKRLIADDFDPEYSEEDFIRKYDNRLNFKTPTNPKMAKYYINKTDNQIENGSFEDEYENSHTYKQKMKHGPRPEIYKNNNKKDSFASEDSEDNDNADQKTRDYNRNKRDDEIQNADLDEKSRNKNETLSRNLNQRFKNKHRCQTDYELPNDGLEDEVISLKNRGYEKKLRQNQHYYKSDGVVKNDEDNDFKVKTKIYSKLKSLRNCEPDGSSNINQIRQHNLQQKIEMYRRLKKELENELAIESLRNNKQNSSFDTYGIELDRMGKVERLLAGFTSNGGDKDVAEVLKYALNSMNPDEVKFEMKDNKTRIQLIKDKDSGASKEEDDPSEICNIKQHNTGLCPCYSKKSEHKTCSCYLASFHDKNNIQKNFPKFCQKLPGLCKCYKIYSSIVKHKDKGLYPKTLSKRPCFIIYRIWPCIYPYFINFIQYIKQGTRFCLFGLAFAFWAPIMCIVSLCLYFCPK